ncbi:hypothetical protein KAW80_03260 [Candidatus Babeliales bacterium]|nr:hypothetical protein [Candidatus Babeliales bacterium]
MLSKQVNIVALSLLLAPSIMTADKIAVFNKIFQPKQDIHTAVYHYKKETKLVSLIPYKTKTIYEIKRKSYPEKISNNESKKIDRGGLVGLDKSKFLVYSDDKNKLSSNLSKSEFDRLGHKHCEELTQGQFFYIAREKKDGKISGYNFTEYNIIKPVVEALEKLDFSLPTSPVPFLPGVTIPNIFPGFNVIKDAQFFKAIDHISNNPYSTKSASIRQSSSIPEEEKNYLNKKEPIVQSTLSKLGIKTNGKAPRIALCCSGGGYRALISTVGLLEGLEEVELLDAITYMATLSGSTWALSTWISENGNIKGLKNYLIPLIENDLKTTKLDESNLKRMFFTKILSLKPLTSIDIWGGLLGNKFLSNKGNKKFETHLYEERTKIEDARKPFPIYTAIEVSNSKKIWTEFTHYEFGSDELGGYIPVWAFGKRFNNGRTVHQTTSPEPLCFCQGIWGSAFTASLSEVLDNFENKLPKEIRINIKNILNVIRLSNTRMSPALIANYTKGLSRSPIKKKSNMTLVDAGLDFNLPLPALLRNDRKVDIIIVCDASANVDTLTDFKAAINYANRSGKNYNINYDGVSQKTISVFKGDSRTKTPTIIFLPLIKNSEYSQNFDPKTADYCNTFNFKYTRPQFEKLSGLTKAAVTQNRNKILEIINAK